MICAFVALRESSRLGFGARAMVNQIRGDSALVG